MQLFQQVQDLRLDCHIQGGGRLIGNQQCRPAGQSHRNHHPLLHPARQLMRIFADAAFRVRDSDRTKQLDHPLPHTVSVFRVMQPDRLSDLLTDRHHRVERGHRLLEDHAHASTALGPHLRL